jgi:glycosyltransferase involved in cell wall biosynthesis
VRAMGRLAIDATAAGSSGGGSRVRELVRTLPQVAPHNEYLFVVGRELAARFDGMPVDTELPPRWARATPFRLSWEHVALPRRLARWRPDWVLSPFNFLPREPAAGWPARTALVVSNIEPFAPEIWSQLRGYDAARIRALRTLTLRSIRRADVVFLLSGEAERRIGPALDGSRVVHVPMAPPAPEILEAAGRARLPFAPSDRPYFVMVGDLRVNKGIEDALGAMEALRRTAPAALLLVCGAPTHRAYTATLRERARSIPAVRFLGRLEHAQVLGLMRGAVATVVCSRVENPNRVPVEAMAVGSPVIAADVPISEEVCGPAAVRYQAGCPEALAEQMAYLLDSPAARDRLIGLGRERLSGLDAAAASRAMLQAMELL